MEERLVIERMKGVKGKVWGGIWGYGGVWGDEIYPFCVDYHFGPVALMGQCGVGMC